ncbi:hypothetical protein [Bacillus sp. JJ722]|uniref:hypothetical protein n=1 Tax=Bacillus sp. JJ722 TaxID=3122973 RepID=UPI003000A65D
MRVFKSQDGKWIFSEDEKVTERVPVEDELEDVDISAYKPNPQDLSALYELALTRSHDIELARKYVKLKGKAINETKHKVWRFVVKESIMGDKNLTKTFNGVRGGLVIYNDGESDLSFTFNDDPPFFTLKANEVFFEEVDPFYKLKITATGKYRAYTKAWEYC